MLWTSSEKKNDILTKKSYVFIALIFTFIVGLVYGSLLAKSQSIQLVEQLSIITKEYASAHLKQTLATTFLNSLCSSSVFIFIPYLLGYSAIGQAASIALPLFKGLGLGLTLGHLYISYGVRGMGYSALVILPQSVIALFAIIIACRESVKLSNLFFCSFLPKKNKSVSLNTIKLYNIKFVILFVIILVSSVVDSISVLLFSGILKIT